MQRVSNGRCECESSSHPKKDDSRNGHFTTCYDDRKKMAVDVEIVEGIDVDAKVAAPVRDDADVDGVDDVGATHAVEPTTCGHCDHAQAPSKEFQQEKKKWMTQ